MQDRSGVICGSVDQAISGPGSADGVPSPINVLVLCPGGLEHGGGIGRQMGYFLAALPQAAETPAYRVIDTRGPWFLGSARWHIPLSALYLVAAAFRIAWAGIAGRPSLLHVNITGRGSTTRKLVLTAIARAVALPYVLHIHDYDYAVDVRARGGLKRCLVRSMFAAAAQIIVLGTEAERSLRAALALPDAPILVLPNAVLDPYPAPRAVGERGGGGPDAHRFSWLSQRPQGRARTLGGVGEPGGGGVAMASDTRRRRPGRRIPGSSRRPWPRRPGGFPRLDRSTGSQRPVRGRGYPGAALARRRVGDVGSGGAGARACSGDDAGRRACRGDRAGAVRPVGAARGRGRAGRGAHPRDRRSSRYASDCAPAPAKAFSTVTTCGFMPCASSACMSGCSAVAAD